MVPRKWRRELRIGPSDEVVLQREGASIVLQSRDEAIRNAQEEVLGLTKSRGSLVAELRRMRREELRRERGR